MDSNDLFEIESTQMKSERALQHQPPSRVLQTQVQRVVASSKTLRTWVLRLLILYFCVFSCWLFEIDTILHSRVPSQVSTRCKKRSFYTIFVLEYLFKSYLGVNPRLILMIYWNAVPEIAFGNHPQPNTHLKTCRFCNTNQKH